MSRDLNNDTTGSQSQTNLGASINRSNQQLLSSQLKHRNIRIPVVERQLIRKYKMYQEKSELQSLIITEQQQQSRTPSKSPDTAVDKIIDGLMRHGVLSPEFQNRNQLENTLSEVIRDGIGGLQPSFSQTSLVGNFIQAAKKKKKKSVPRKIKIKKINKAAAGNGAGPKISLKQASTHRMEEEKSKMESPEKSQDFLQVGDPEMSMNSPIGQSTIIEEDFVQRVKLLEKKIVKKKGINKKSKQIGHSFVQEIIHEAQRENYLFKVEQARIKEEEKQKELEEINRRKKQEEDEKERQRKVEEENQQRIEQMIRKMQEEQEANKSLSSIDNDLQDKLRSIMEFGKDLSYSWDKKDQSIQIEDIGISKISRVSFERKTQSLDMNSPQVDESILEQFRRYQRKPQYFQDSDDEVEMLKQLEENKQPRPESGRSPNQEHFKLPVRHESVPPNVLSVIYPSEIKQKLLLNLAKVFNKKPKALSDDVIQAQIKVKKLGTTKKDNPVIQREELKIRDAEDDAETKDVKVRQVKELSQRHLKHKLRKKIDADLKVVEQETQHAYILYDLEAGIESWNAYLDEDNSWYDRDFLPEVIADGFVKRRPSFLDRSVDFKSTNTGNWKTLKLGDMLQSDSIEFSKEEFEDQMLLSPTVKTGGTASMLMHQPEELQKREPLVRQNSNKAGVTLDGVFFKWEQMHRKCILRQNSCTLENRDQKPRRRLSFDETLGGMPRHIKFNFELEKYFTKCSEDYDPWFHEDLNETPKRRRYGDETQQSETDQSELYDRFQDPYAGSQPIRQKSMHRRATVNAGTPSHQQSFHQTFQLQQTYTTASTNVGSRLRLTRQSSGSQGIPADMSTTSGSGHKRSGNQIERRQSIRFRQPETYNPMVPTINEPQPVPSQFSGYATMATNHGMPPYHHAMSANNLIYSPQQEEFQEDLHLAPEHRGSTLYLKNHSSSNLMGGMSPVSPNGSPLHHSQASMIPVPMAQRPAYSWGLVLKKLDKKPYFITKKDIIQIEHLFDFKDPSYRRRKWNNIQKQIISFFDNPIQQKLARIRVIITNHGQQMTWEQLDHLDKRETDKLQPVIYPYIYEALYDHCKITEDIVQTHLNPNAHFTKDFLEKDEEILSIVTRINSDPQLKISLEDLYSYWTSFFNSIINSYQSSLYTPPKLLMFRFFYKKAKIFPDFADFIQNKCLDNYKKFSRSRYYKTNYSRKLKILSSELKKYEGNAHECIIIQLNNIKMQKHNMKMSYGFDIESKPSAEVPKFLQIKLNNLYTNALAQLYDPEDYQKAILNKQRLLKDLVYEESYIKQYHFSNVICQFNFNASSRHVRGSLAPEFGYISYCFPTDTGVVILMENALKFMVNEMDEIRYYDNSKTLITKEYLSNPPSPSFKRQNTRALEYRRSSRGSIRLVSLEGFKQENTKFSKYPTNTFSDASSEASDSRRVSSLFPGVKPSGTLDKQRLSILQRIQKDEVKFAIQEEDDQLSTPMSSVSSQDFTGSHRSFNSHSSSSHHYSISPKSSFKPASPSVMIPSENQFIFKQGHIHYISKMYKKFADLDEIRRNARIQEEQEMVKQSNNNFPSILMKKSDSYRLLRNDSINKRIKQSDKVNDLKRLKERFSIFERKENIKLQILLKLNTDKRLIESKEQVAHNGRRWSFTEVDINPLAYLNEKESQIMKKFTQKAKRFMNKRVIISQVRHKKIQETLEDLEVEDDSFELYNENTEKHYQPNFINLAGANSRTPSRFGDEIPEEFKHGSTPLQTRSQRASSRATPTDLVNSKSPASRHDTQKSQIKRSGGASKVDLFEEVNRKSKKKAKKGLLYMLESGPRVERKTSHQMLRNYSSQFEIYDPLKQAQEIFDSILRNDLVSVTDQLIRYAGVQLEQTDVNGNTMLNVSVQCNFYEISELLLKKGANVDTKNKEGNTPLHYAVSYGYKSLINLLCQYKADQKVKNKLRRSPWEGIQQMNCVLTN